MSQKWNEMEKLLKYVKGAFELELIFSFTLEEWRIILKMLLLLTKSMTGLETKGLWIPPCLS